MKMKNALILLYFYSPIALSAQEVTYRTIASISNRAGGLEQFIKHVRTCPFISPLELFAKP